LSERFCRERTGQLPAADEVSLRMPPLICHQDARRAKVQEWLCRVSHCNRRVVMSPGGYNPPEKRWPARCFGEVAARLLDDGIGVVLLGAAEERPVVDEVAATASLACSRGAGQLLNLAGQTDLLDLPILFDLTDLHVTNDNGLGHLAGALNRIQVILYLGPDADHVTLGFQDVALFSGARGMEAIRTEDVLTAVRRLLGHRPDYC
jgi:ADP-heptose:LPS heptosyltransferase